MSEVKKVRVAPQKLPDVAKALIDAGGRMQFAYAWKSTLETLELRYVADRPQRAGLVVWCVRPKGPMPSLVPVSPLMSWYEREITDLFGVGFEGNPEPYPLVLHPGVNPAMPASGAVDTTTAAMAPGFEDSGYPDVSTADIQQLPFGPIRAGVVESVRLDFFYIGEHILHLHPRLFFKHRGMEKRFEGQSLSTATILAERVSGVGSFAHALAFCQAVEGATGCEVPERARMLRCLCAELERLYNHLHYLGHLADTTTLKVGQAEGHLLEERVKQINGRLTGSRFLRSLLKPGGLRRDLTGIDWLADAVEQLRADAAKYIARLEASNSYLDRLITTGELDRQTAFDQGAAGPIERASGLNRDLRRDYPYAAYARLPIEVPLREDGDAYARAKIRGAEAIISMALIQRILLLIHDGPVSAPCPAPTSADGLGWTESPRGGLFYAVHFDAEGRLARVKIKSPSFSNWRVFPFTVQESNMMDYAINEASFGMTVAGCDR